MRVAAACVLVLLAAAACQAAKPAAGEVYRSAHGGYTFAVPETWAGHYRVDTVPAQTDLARHSGLDEVITFSYLPRDTTVRPQVLLALVTLPRVEWDRMSQEEGPPQGDLLGEQGDLVVVAALPQSNPFDSLSPDGLKFDAIRLTLEQVRRALILD